MRRQYCFTIYHTHNDDDDGDDDYEGDDDDDDDDDFSLFLSKSIRLMAMMTL